MHGPEENQASYVSNKYKLEDKSFKLIFIRCDPKSKAYESFDHNNSKIVIIKDVEFNEGDV